MKDAASIQKLWVLLFAAFIDMLGYAMLFPLLPFYAVRFGAGPKTIGWMVATFSIAQVTASPLWGRFSDRWGRRPAVMVGLAGNAIAFFIFGIANAVWLLFLSRFAQGASGGTTGVMQAYIGDSVPPEDRAKALGWLSAATNTGVMIGPALGSLTFRFGHSVPGIVASLLCLSNLVFAWRLLPEPSREILVAASSPESSPSRKLGGGSAAGKRSVRTMIWETLRHPGGDTSQLIWIYAVAMTALSSMTAVLGLYMMERFSLDESNIGYLFVLLGAISIVLRGGALGYLVSTFGEVKLMRMGAGCLAVGLAVFPLPGRIPVLLVVMALIPVGTAMLFPSSTGLLSRRGDRGQLGQLMGVQQSFGGVARILGPIWAGAAYGVFGRSVPFYFAGAVVGLVSALTMRVRPGPGRTSEEIQNIESIAERSGQT